MGSEVDRAQSREPRMKKFTAEMKTRRVPNRSASQPPKTRKVAAATMNALVSMPAVTPSSP